MSGTVTHFFGRALTGQGMKALYKELMENEANTIYLLKGASGFKVSELIKKLGYHYNNQGADIEYFHDPLFENVFEALYIQHPHNILFLHTANITIDPKLSKPTITIPLHESVNVQKLLENGEQLLKLSETKEDYHNKYFASINKALKIHDDWEVETRRQMDWGGLNKQIEEFFQHLFGTSKLEKEGKRTHRLLGTLTPAGARDTLQSITQNLEQRLFIKGYPGTGKSSMLKKLANEAQARGYDVQLVWCGLDSNSIDMVILPELKFCIFDSTEPHVYFPDETRPGDVIFDIAKHCHPTKVEEANIKEIVAKYKSAIYDAIAYANLYAEAERKVREIHDAAINMEEFESRVKGLFGE
ncbi:nucleotide kinase [Lysinibacillus antri]|nr:nucleotide kinase [Lysinibacillus antri]